MSNSNEINVERQTVSRRRYYCEQVLSKKVRTFAKRKMIQFLKKYIINLNDKNPLIDYQIERIVSSFHYYQDPIFPLKFLFLLANEYSKTKFINCLKEIYALYIKYFKHKYTEIKNNDTVINLSNRFNNSFYTSS